MSALLELAAACEKATGPDRFLDHSIALFANNNGRLGAYQSSGAWLAAAMRENWNSPRYTASLDAALTLYVSAPERIPTNPRFAAAEALRQRAEVQHG